MRRTVYFCGKIVYNQRKRLTKERILLCPDPEEDQEEAASEEAASAVEIAAEAALAAVIAEAVFTEDITIITITTDFIRRSSFGEDPITDMAMGAAVSADFSV